MLNSTCVIRRYTSSSKDAHGNLIKVWSDLATDVACRLQPRRGREAVQPTQVVIGSHVLFLETGTDITERDRVVVAASTYEVLFVADAAGQGHHLEAELEIVKE
jgi:head-tail adaptor